MERSIWTILEEIKEEQKIEFVLETLVKKNLSKEEKRTILDQIEHELKIINDEGPDTESDQIEFLKGFEKEWFYTFCYWGWKEVLHEIKKGKTNRELFWEEDDTCTEWYKDKWEQFVAGDNQQVKEALWFWYLEVYNITRN